MKQYIKLTLTIIAGIMILSSCSKTNKQAKWIPKNAMAVVHINGKSLTAKLSWDEIKQTAWFKKLQSDNARPAWTNKILDNPGTSGINIKSDFIIFFQRTPGDESVVVVEGDVKDAKAFEEFNKNMHTNTTASKDGDVNLLSINNEAVVGWNGSRFVYVFNSPFNKMNYNNYNFADTSAKMATVGGSGAKLLASCKNIFALKSDSSMAKDEKFTALLKEDGDIHYWQNTEEIVSGSSQLGMLSMLKLDVFLKGNISTITASFDDGKITVKHKMYAGKELTDIFKKYGGGSIDRDMVKNIPSQNIAGVMALHFKPEGIKELIKLTGMDGFLNMFISQQGFTIDDFVAANKGDIMFAVSDLTMKKDTAGYMHEKPDVNFLFSAGIGDKNAFDKLINAGKKITAEMHNDSAVHYAKNDKYFAVGNNQQFVNKYIAGNNSKFDFLDKLSGHPAGFFIDINKILQAFTGITMDSSAKVLLNQSVAMWANVYSTGGEFKDDALTSTTEINLVDKTTNSLKQLNKYLDEVSKVMMAKQKKQEEMWNRTDSTLTNIPYADTPVTKPLTH